MVVEAHQSPKFTPKWQGPFRISRKQEKIIFLLNWIDKEQVVHVNRLKYCFEILIWKNAMRNGNSYHNPMSNLPLPLFPKIGNDQEAIETAPQLQSKRTIRLSPHNSSTPRRIQRDRPLISSSPSLSSPRRNDSSSDESKSALETSSDGSRQSNNSNLLQSPHRPQEMSQEQNG